MAKSGIQGAFDFFSDEPEEVSTPEITERKSPLLPPQHIIEAEETAVAPVQQEEHNLFFTKEINTSEPEKTEEEEIEAPIINTATKEEAIIKVTVEEEVLIEESLSEEDVAVPPANENAEKLSDKIKKQDFTIPQHKRPSGSRGRRSVKENSMIADLVEIPSDDVLFQKQYYSMGDVTVMFKENHSLIRYWASEFTILKPKKNKKGDRFFRPEDIKNLQIIHDLLRRKKYTIEGAKEYLKNLKKAEEKFAAIQSLQHIKTFFLELKANI